ncbi:protein of unknown function [Methylorubrum extorquens]|uniref:Uncharacterized protein n=1 Tax=Methylorubrum extorquens TaxID=408 RepID=A0A2N9AXQ4_METEX|nr:protein of unknown function [Methylorubrum extorquens]
MTEWDSGAPSVRQRTVCLTFRVGKACRNVPDARSARSKRLAWHSGASCPLEALALIGTAKLSCDRWQVRYASVSGPSLTRHQMAPQDR